MTVSLKDIKALLTPPFHCPNGKPIHECKTEYVNSNNVLVESKVTIYDSGSMTWMETPKGEG